MLPEGILATKSEKMQKEWKKQKKCLILMACSYSTTLFDVQPKKAALLLITFYSQKNT